MFLFLLLILPNVETFDCDGVILHDVYHNKELILNNYGRPNNLMIHKFTGTLFFSHTISNGTDLEIVSYDFNKNTTDVIDIPGGYAIAYDAGNDDIYFGGHDGIYKYNFLTKSADFFAEDGKSIWGLYVGKNFYYISYPSQKLYVYQDDVFVHVAEAIDIEIDNFYISKSQNIYFSNKTALYKVEKSGGDAIVINDEFNVCQIAEDNYGDVYFCGIGGIYVEQNGYRVHKIAEIDVVYGIAFDENDFIVYSDKDSIYRLVPDSKKSKCKETITDIFD